ncbi:MAG: replicative DNA helicase [Candidatus Hydrogenedentes bacterium]|nr:replicative DNA helicase [Candidatus Hydrogenedentota bacterium]
MGDQYRIAPQAVEAERSVLGALLVEPDEVVGEVVRVLGATARMFYVEPHSMLYAHLTQMYLQRTPIDPTTVLERLSRAGRLEEIGGSAYLAELISAVPSTANVGYYAQLVRDAFVLRELMALGEQLTRAAGAGSGSPMEVLESTEGALLALRDAAHGGRELTPVAVGLEEDISAIMDIYASGTLGGLSTGISSQDRILGGLQPGDVTILAARPSVGKTAFSLNVARYVAMEQESAVAFFSLEMSARKLRTRLLYMVGRVSKMEVVDRRCKQIDLEQRLEYARGRLSKIPLYVFDGGGITPATIRGELRRLNRKQPPHGRVKLVVVDYLQLMTHPEKSNQNREAEVAALSRELKALAVEEHVHVMALSQLSRAGDGEPDLKHLRESGAIEQDADAVIFLYRAPDAQEGLITLKIAKNRDGETGVCEAYFRKDYQEFRAVVRERDPATVTSPVQSEYEYDEDEHGAF